MISEANVFYSDECTRELRDSNFAQILANMAQFGTVQLLALLECRGLTTSIKVATDEIFYVAGLAPLFDDVAVGNIGWEGNLLIFSLLFFIL